ncbi:SIS domain-containing protein [Bradyrhizobium sp. 40]|uniref:D-sedoheptulose-7-phosphate isomerase n=1 Tax=Bradyrhizobium sp. 40 TaxID=2782674 RepID=UPI001FFFE654|nr:SIS domain-containing protein [Bradyrhizobium sp. 40]UPJ41132.1 SIS domain-containing protein [Bradyrhizobium sp. 40]
MTQYSRIYFNKLKSAIDMTDSAEVEASIGAIERAWQGGKQIITLGNGGSAMTAIHFITDWSKMISMHSGRPFYGRTLLDNVGMVTAYANDVSYAEIFSEQLKHTAGRGDVVVAISGSGNSANVVRAVELANEIGCETIGLCGFDGGKLRKLAKYPVWVDIDDMQICEDIHAVFGHIVMQRLCGGVKEAAVGSRRIAAP